MHGSTPIKTYILTLIYKKAFKTGAVFPDNKDLLPMQQFLLRYFQEVFQRSKNSLKVILYKNPDFIGVVDLMLCLE